MSYSPTNHLCNNFVGHGIFYAEISSANIFFFREVFRIFAPLRFYPLALFRRNFWGSAGNFWEVRKFPEGLGKSDSLLPAARQKIFSKPVWVGTTRTQRAKGRLISEPRFPTPCEMRFFPREKGKTAFVEGFSLKFGRFPFLAWEKSHLAGGRKSGLTN